MNEPKTCSLPNVKILNISVAKHYILILIYVLRLPGTMPPHHNGG